MLDKNLIIKVNVIAFLLLFSPAQAQEPNTEVPKPHRAILFSPLSPILTILVHNEIQKDDKEAELLGLGVMDINIRGLHIPQQGMGFLAQLDFTTVNILVRSTHIGARVGPRFALRGQGISDWTATPFIMAGYTVNSAGETPLSRWGVLGIGGQMGRTWVWKHLINELDIGLYGTKNIGYTILAPSLKNTSAPEILPIKPLFNWSVGYAF